MNAYKSMFNRDLFHYDILHAERTQQATFFNWLCGELSVNDYKKKMAVNMVKLMEANVANA